MHKKPKAPRNRTITLVPAEIERYQREAVQLSSATDFANIENRIINQDLFKVLNLLPNSFADVLFIDPPYNLAKSFNSTSFARRSDRDYAEWFASWFPKLLRTLKPQASVYVCGDWRTSAVIFPIIDRHLIVRNRITWEREKGRGARRNWKSNAEDIFFCTVSDNYTFNADAVKLKRRVIAPYTDANGTPKDWQATVEGNYRMTHPSNIWTDLTVPFWSMRENTEHPTQKPEKLLAKIILASSEAGDVIFDPFIGSGTSSVVAKKLERKFVGIEIDPLYTCLAIKRLEMADDDRSIQGYSDGIFWEHNSTFEQKPLTSNQHIKPPRLLLDQIED